MLRRPPESARLANNGMQLTKAAGCAPRATPQGQSLRAAFAADPECCTDRGTDRKVPVPPPSAAMDAPLCYRAQTAPAWKAVVRSISGLGLLSEPARPSSNIMSTAARPSRFHRHLRGSTSVTKGLGPAFTIGTPRLGCARPYNNGLHQTGREGAAGFLRRRPVVEARPAGEPECWAVVVARGVRRG